MYTEYFQLKEPPFSITPNPRYLFMSLQHQEALAHLLYGVGVGGGFVLLTGEAGTGKTTLCHCLLEQQPEDVDIAWILNPRLNVVELLSSICDELRIPYPEDTESLKVLVDLLNEYLLSANARGRRTVVMIDEAQNLGFEVLEQIRLLTNLETSRAKLLQIILVGQPELNRVLERQELRQLAQRITARYHLQPLSTSETAEYIHHRIAVSGRHSRLFSSTSLRKVHRLSGGIPRLINIICDRALLGAYTSDRPKVDMRIVRKAAREVLPTAFYRRVLRPWAVIIVSILVGSSAVFYYRSPGLPTLAQADHRVERTSTGTTDIESDRSEDKVTDPELQSKETAVVETQDTLAETVSPGSRRSGSGSFEQASLVQLPLNSKEKIDVEARDTLENNVFPASRTSFADLIRDPSLSLQTAFAQLFSRWGLDDVAGHENHCQGARQRGLHCLFEHGTWNDLRRFNRPGILEFLLEDGQKRYATLIALDHNNLILDLGGERLSFPLEAVLPFWQGEYSILWKPPTRDVLLIKPGETAASVLWLRRQLAKSGEASVAKENASYFDEALKERVVAFQKSHGLAQGGVVGPYTLIHLNNAVNTPGIPRLAPGKE